MCVCVCVQQELMDAYWAESTVIVDEMLKDAQSEAARGKRGEASGSMGSWVRRVWNLINVLNVFWGVTRYLHQRQWAYLNKLAGFKHIASANGNGSMDSAFGIIRMFGGKLKFILASIWGMVFVAFGWKLFKDL